MGAASEVSSVRLVATLGAAGLVSGVVLSGVFLATQPRIERNRAEALRAAIFHVLPGTESTHPLTLIDGRLVQASSDSATAGAPTVHVGLDGDGARVGYAIAADGPGFMDTVGLIYGFDPARRAIVGLAVLESRETPGLGDKIVHDPDFLANFEQLEVEPTILAVKRSAGTAANEVDCITGATISSEAVVAILNRSTASWMPLLDAHDRPDGEAR